MKGGFKRMNGDHILLVDDERGLLKMVNSLLQKEGFTNVYTATTGTEALRWVKTERIDLIVLDIMLPDMNGFDLCRQIRQETKAPIIFLTARTSDLDKITGLTIGGDDYMSKPFNPLELLARIKAQLRRTTYFQLEKTEKNNAYHFGRFSLYVNEGTLLVKGRQVKCPLKEFELLKFFCENPNHVFSTQTLYEKVWGEDSCGDERTVMVHISRLREKIEEDPQHPQLLVNVRGLGYKLVSM